MRYPVTCKTCGATIFVRGNEEYDVNALVLDDNDWHWDEACEHIKSGGDYDIGEGEAEEP
jgi:hypothetical protein